MKQILYFSIILNFIFISIVFIKFKNNIKHFIERKHFNSTNIDYNERIKHLESLPNNDSTIVFIGDSYIEKCEWNELLENQKIINRGVSSDNINGLNKRLNKIKFEKTSKIFVLIGSNDLINDNYNYEFQNHYETLIKNLLLKIFNDKIFIISILPSDNIKRKNKNIIKSNTYILNLCKKYKISFIDVYDEFLNSRSINAYTYDGLHLNSDGYIKLKQILSKYIN